MKKAIAGLVLGASSLGLAVAPAFLSAAQADGPGPGGLGPSGCIATGPAAPPAVNAPCSFTEGSKPGGYVGAAQSWTVVINGVSKTGSGPVNATGSIPPGATVTVTVTNGIIAAGNATGTANG
jgi:hypothetical protein